MTTSSEVVPAQSRRWWPWVLGAVIVGAAVIVGFVALSGGDDGSDAEATDTVNFADVVRTDLVEIESYNATLGTIGGDPITSQRSGTVTSAIDAGVTAVAGEVVYRVDGEPVVLMYGDTPVWRDLAPTEDTTALVNRLNGTITSVVPEGTVLSEGDIAFHVDGEPVVVMYGTAPAYRVMFDAATNLEGDDVFQLEAFLDAAGYNDVGMDVDGEFTSATETVVEDWQADIGASDDGVVGLGEVFFIPGSTTVVDVAVEVGDTVSPGFPVLTLAGETPMMGDDVRQLEENLAALGFDADGSLVVDDLYDDATSAAVSDWQTSVGVDATGRVGRGDIVFVSDAIRVSDQLATPGTAVGPGTPVLAVSSAQKVVTLLLPAEDQDVIEEGDSVVVELPDGSDVAATITEVASVATINQQGAAVFEVTVELADDSAAAGLDEAPVDVEIVTDSVQNVIAVPVTALLALAEGGYAVEVETTEGTRLVSVDPGFFADGLVELESGDVGPGDRVVVP
ncbi:MAG: peptidoglycan-binding protein [Acidimicrobiia bacterium]|nr:peptidoglycan-binding protein [Acidimicrobiia bacterium]